MTSEWTEIGQKYTDTKIKKDAVLAETLRLEWHDLPGDGTLIAPMSQGCAINTIIADKDIGGRPIAVSWNGVIENRYCLIGVRYVFKDAIVNSYWLDIGTEIMCLLTEKVEDVKPS